ncbi:MAG: hypothetical protein M0Z84_08215 [Gammaproteobacteria bacterium]|nr:hypothetical protein [Gammaproteobacteria bacterium]
MDHRLEQQRVGGGTTRRLGGSEVAADEAGEYADGQQQIEGRPPKRGDHFVPYKRCFSDLMLACDGDTIEEEHREQQHSRHDSGE